MILNSWVVQQLNTHSSKNIRREQIENEIVPVIRQAAGITEYSDRKLKRQHKVTF